MIDQLILGLLVAMFASFGGVAWKFRGRIEKLPDEATEKMKADLLKAIEKNGEAIAGNRDRIDEVHRDLGARIDRNRDRIDGNRDRIDEVRKDLGVRIDRNRDRIDEVRKDLSGQIDGVRKDLSGQIGYTNRRVDEVWKDLSDQMGHTNHRIDDIYRHLLSGDRGAEPEPEAEPASGEPVNEVS